MSEEPQPAGGDADIKAPGWEAEGYRITGLLGEGGMGVVYAAEHIRLGRRVALKMLRASYNADPESVKRFFAEARAVNQIGHEHVVEVTDFFEAAAGHPENFYIMELLEGDELKDLMGKGVLPLSRSLGIATQLARALQAVHDAGIIHRDIKPHNVFLTTRAGRQDFVKLLDFGVAKLGPETAKDLSMTATGAIIGTPKYMSPEQLNGEKVDHTSDIYAFGLLLYEMVTGRRAFDGKGLGELAVKHLTAKPKPPSTIKGLPHEVPADLEALILHCLEKAQGDRPQSMAEVASRISLVADAGGYPLERAFDRPVTGPHPVSGHYLMDSAPTPTAPRPAVPAPAPSRSPMLMVAGAGLVIALVIGVVALSGEETAPPTPPPVVTTTPPPEPEPVEPAPAPEPETVKVAVVSSPEGAEVRIGAEGEVLGVTPTELTFPKGEAPVTLTFTLDNHEPEERTLTPQADAQLEVALKRKRRKQQRRRRRLNRTDVANPYE